MVTMSDNVEIRMHLGAQARTAFEVVGTIPHWPLQVLVLHTCVLPPATNAGRCMQCGGKAIDAAM